MKDSEEVLSVQFSPKEFSLTAMVRHGKDIIARTWSEGDLQKIADHRVPQKGRPESAVECLKFSHKGNFIASAHQNGKISIWNGKTGKHRVSLERQSKSPGWLLFSSDDLSLISSDDKTVLIWDTATWRLRQKLMGHQERMLYAIFSANGQRIASVSDDYTIRVWESRTVKSDHEIEETAEIFCFNVEEKDIEKVSVVFSSDGRQLASCMDSGRIIKVWDLESGASEDTSPNFTMIGREEIYISHNIVFSLDGKSIIAAGTNHLSLWDIQSKQRIRTVEVPMLFQSLALNKRHPGYVFTEGGPYLIGDSTSNATSSASEQQPVCMLGKQLAVPSNHLPQTTYKLSSDGSRIIRDEDDWICVPGEYHPLVYSSHGRKIAMGYKSGFVTLLDFSGDEDSSVLGVC
ncbi:WD40-repeat-containing domain protein [Trichoderma chlorosporum]